MQLRAAHPDDYPAIVRLCGDLAEHVGDRSRARVTIDQLARGAVGPAPAWRGIVAAGPDCLLAGMCLYSIIFSTWRGQPGLYVIDLIVDEPYRGGGLGHQLLAEAAREAAKQGCGFMRLEVDHDNRRAIAFYERLGFVADDAQQSYALGGADFERLLAS
jgi:ribosomal protein S18 acetylase RimI-like enzyme